VEGSRPLVSSHGSREPKARKISNCSNVLTSGPGGTALPHGPAE
jgi:hypothetical protein